MLLAVVGTIRATPAEAACGNPVQCENALPGDPTSDWQVVGAGDSTIQGFATQMSVNVGQTESFKITTPSTSYHIDILRLGYYGGNGARKIASHITPTATLPQTQPACLTQSSTGLIDCGNWGVSASWTVPSTAVSGLYVAHLVRDDAKDPGGDSQILFVVRNDSSHSAILLQTSDETWQAYNNYGGNSLYTCTVACPPGNPLAYKGADAVSYNRPFDGALATDTGRSDPYYAEYQMISFLERNGYDLSYTSGSDVDSSGSLLLNHKVFVSSGHDEYWSKAQRANVKAARDAGVNLAFFSGNEMFWKTRWSSSIDSSGTPNRTLITYKETHYNAHVDPAGPLTWTGAWADPRFSPPGDGGAPANALTGQQFLVNSGTSDISVPYQYSRLRFWRNTAVAQLQSGQTYTLGNTNGTLGYEWDTDQDNGFRPAGEFDLSSTRVSGLQAFTDYGSTLSTNATVIHHLTLYRASSGALVFGAGTVQWSWGLDVTNAWGSAGPLSTDTPDRNMQQATVNLLAEMGAQPTTLLTGLVAAAKSTDTTAPASTISSPSNGASVQANSALSISGTANDTGGGVAEVDVSTDGGSSWHPASGTTNWTYTWNARTVPSTTILSRAVDDSGNIEPPSAGIRVTVTCPCSIWNPSSTPGTVDSGDPGSVEVGVKFTSDTFGTVTGLRFYKASANTGTHVGSLWTASGALLASATFTGESASGWQQVSFSQPIQINANTTYVAAYLAPNGRYSADTDYFLTPSPTGGNTLDSPPLHAVPASSSASNGLYSYTTATAFPTNSFQSTNYWVDPVFLPSPAPGQVTGVTATAGSGSVDLTWTAPSSGGAVTTYTITPYVGSTAQTTTTVSGSPPSTSTTISGLTNGTTYTFTVQASNPNGTGPVSAASNSVTPAAGVSQPPPAPTNVLASAASSQAQVSWTAPVSNGGSPITGYTVTPFTGSTAGTPVQAGASATSVNVGGLTNGTNYTFTVTATNAAGNSPASTASSAVTPADTIFDFASPATVDGGDTSAIELGAKFTADSSGTITGIRFYKAAANTGTHVVSLWTSSGTLLASANSSGESASGWQQVNFSGPVAITAGTTYVAGYFAPNGHYSYTGAAFSASAVNNPPLHAISNSTSANGVYAYGSASIFPSSSYNSANYWVDVDFQPRSGGATAPTAPTNVAAIGASSQAQVSWTAPSSDGGSPITGYAVTPYVGSTAGTPTQVSASATTATVNSLTNGASYTFTVTATNAAGNSPASTASNTVKPADTIFDFATPATVDGGDTSPVELGVEFTADSNGTIPGLRFYKAAANTGTHVVSLWTSGGTLLASANSSGETASGWQQVDFSTPVAITAGTTYVAGYFAPNGHYSYTSAAFAGSVDNAPLHAVANSTAPNGVFAYSPTSTFPTGSFNSANYWVDVDFQPGSGPAAPTAPTNAAAIGASNQAQVSWTAPSSDGGSPITGYAVTPYVGSTAGTPTQVSASATTATVKSLTNGASYTFTVTATNAAGNSPASTASNTVKPADTIFDFATPATVDSGDTSPVELGVKFTADVNGSVTGIRFYKAAANTGPHVVSLWTSGGTLLASANSSGETASGWQQVDFSTPVAITAGTTYVAGYLDANGHYSFTGAAFASSSVDNPPLHALANSLSPNGVYAYSSTSTFPTGSFNSANYWVDVDFQ